MDDARIPIRILLADDDADDRMLVQEAFGESRLANELFCVEDGVQLMDFLHRRGAFVAPTLAPRPGLILLDLNMPRMGGRECLIEIKADPSLRDIPVIILTTSKAEEDIWQSYQSGANSFITKPVTFDSLVRTVSALGRYWFEIVELPQRGTSRADGRHPHSSAVGR